MTVTDVEESVSKMKYRVVAYDGIEVASMMLLQIFTSTCAITRRRQWARFQSERRHYFLVSTCVYVRYILCAALASFYIEVDFNGTWTDARKATFQSAADRYRSCEPSV